MQVCGDGAPSPCANAGCAIVWPQPAGCGVEGCGDAVGDTDHHLMAPARQSMHKHNMNIHSFVKECVRLWLFTGVCQGMRGERCVRVREEITSPTSHTATHTYTSEQPAGEVAARMQVGAAQNST